MTSFVHIGKNGTIKDITKNNLIKENLYKYCGFKKPDGFEKRTTWDVTVEGNHHIVELWARDFGNAGSENKYDFPPPCDSSLFFGTCALIKTSKDDDTIKDMVSDTWLKIYEKLFGGFEDLGNEDSEESDDELDSVSSEYKTKNGYLKDGFVVDSTSDKSGDDVDNGSDAESCECSSSDEGSELEEEDYDYSSDE